MSQRFERFLMFMVCIFWLSWMFLSLPSFLVDSNYYKRLVEQDKIDETCEEQTYGVF